AMPQLDPDQERAVLELIEALKQEPPALLFQLRETRARYNQEFRSQIEAEKPTAQQLSDIRFAEANRTISAVRNLLAAPITRASVADLRTPIFDSRDDSDPVWRSIEGDVRAYARLILIDICEMQRTGWGPHCNAARRLCVILRAAN